MNNQRKPLIIGVAAAVVAAIILGVVLFSGGGETTDASVADRPEQADTAAPVPDSEPDAASLEETTRTEESQAEATNAAADMPAEVPDQVVVVAPPAEEEEPLLGSDEFLDDDMILEQLAEYGSFKALYDAASPSQREDIIDYLASEERLRDEIVNLLPTETDPELRTYMLLRTDPEGFYDPDVDEDFFDDELRDLLEQQPATPITEDEWLARMDLAYLMDDSYGMQWVRDGRQAFPSSEDINLLASTLTLNINASTGEPNSGEVQQSSQYIMDTLNGANAQNFSADQRMRAYWALFWSPNQPASLSWLQQQQQHESNPQASDTLERIIDHLQSSANASTP